MFCLLNVTQVLFPDWLPKSFPPGSCLNICEWPGGLSLCVSECEFAGSCPGPGEVVTCLWALDQGL